MKGSGSPGPADARAGPLRFARFAYPPNALGYCGPADPAGFLGAAKESDLAELSSLAVRFEGAWPYLELIASSNHIDDPLDPRVVDAYWVGNRLLERVPPSVLASHLEDRFGHRTGHDFPSLAQAALCGGAPHHSFHVFAVYPWLGLLRAGMDGAPLVVLDQCRIRWGVVVSVNGERATVEDTTLAFDGHRLVPGARRTQEVRHAAGGNSLCGTLARGDRVALHWDWVCEKLTDSAARRLDTWTGRMLRAANSLDHPGPIEAVNR